MKRAFYAVRYEVYPGRTDLSRSFAKIGNARKLARVLGGEIVEFCAGRDCKYPGRCLMPGDHLPMECHTVEMIEEFNAESSARESQS